MNIYKNDMTKDNIINLEMNNISTNQIRVILQLAIMKYKDLLKDDIMRDIAKSLEFNETEVNNLYEIFCNKYNRDLVIAIKNEEY